MWKILSKLSILALAAGGVASIVAGAKIHGGTARTTNERRPTSGPHAVTASASGAGAASDQHTGTASDQHTGAASGDILLDSAMGAVESRDSVSARVRVQIDMFGQQLFGNGNYLQKGRGDQRKYRWEMAIQSPQGKSAIEQVSNGSRLWIHETVMGQKKLRFVDLEALRKAALLRPTPPMPAAPQPMALGGLRGMLHRLQDNFQFGPARRTEWNGVSVWITRGVWHHDSLDQLLAPPITSSEDGKKPKRRSAPSRLPKEVVLFIDTKTLFPHRVEYHAKAHAHRASLSESSPPFFALELLEVQFDVTISDTRFSRPSNLPSTNVTGRYLRQLGLDDAAGSDTKEHR